MKPGSKDYNLLPKRLKSRIALNGTPMTELRDVTCHMGSHSFTCHPTPKVGLRVRVKHVK